VTKFGMQTHADAELHMGRVFVDRGHRWEENVTFNLPLYKTTRTTYHAVALMTSLLWLRHQCRIAAGLRTFTYSTPLCLYKAQTERTARYIFTGWSAQRDKHGAFKLKPSEVRFQLVLNIGVCGSSTCGLKLHWVHGIITH